MIKSTSDLNLFQIAIAKKIGGGGGSNVDETARTLATEAKDAANVAQTTANNAKSAAEAAQSTSNTNAGNIQTINSSISTINSTLVDKEDKPTIITTSESIVTITLNANTIMQCDEVTTLTVSVPESVTGGYMVDVSFTSGATATNVTMPDVELCSGDDCVDNIFMPLANKRYNASFWYDGKYVVGSIQGNKL